MKTLNQIPLIAIVLLLAYTTQSTSARSFPGKKTTNQQDFITIRGKVVDATSREPLVFASVGVQESNIGIITNLDGEFSLKIDGSLSTGNLVITYLGYKNKTVPISELRGNKNVITMDPAPIPIKEIVVRPVDPVDIVSKAISRINRNYESEPNLMTAFYRETIKKNRNYVSIGEAAVEIFKAPYANDVRFDGARIYKGRKSSDVEKMDTVLFKLQGGPVSVLQLDIVKNTESILTHDAMEYYDYSISGVVELNNKPHYVIDFVQKPSVEIPLFMGSLFIEMDSYAISEVEFGFNLSDKNAAVSIFIRKKPLGMDVFPEVASYRTQYREHDGVMHFAYSRAEVRFKINWKKKLFNTYYTTMSEIAVTDRTDKEVIKFAGRERIKFSDVFSEKVSSFTDDQFWGDYNVIEPDQSIESAIRRLSRKLRFSEVAEDN
jgi:hypothetical protein